MRCRSCSMGGRPGGGPTRAYQGQAEVIGRCVPRAQDHTNRCYSQGGWIDEAVKASNREKSRARAKVEHSIEVIKCLFGFQKVRNRGGRAKNRHRLEVTAALANLFIVRRQLLQR